MNCWAIFVTSLRDETVGKDKFRRRGAQRFTAARDMAEVPLGKRDPQQSLTTRFPMPRFVLLYHDCPPHYERPSHWDLMLQAGEALRTWALPRLPHAWAVFQQRTASSYPDCPPVACADSVGAERLADHRLDYLDLEGPLSGDRGTVRRIDCGTYASQSDSPACRQLTLASGNWKGRITLQQSAGDENQWTLAVDTSES